MDPLLRRALFTGFLGSVAGMHVGLIGMLASFQRLDVIADVITLGRTIPIVIALLVGWRAGAPMRSPHLRPEGGRAIGLGALAGAVTGVMLALFAIFITTVDIQWVLQNANQATADVLQYEQGPGLGSAILIGVSIAMGAAGASLNVIPGRIARALVVGGLTALTASLMEPFLGAVLRNLSLDVIEDFLYSGSGLTLRQLHRGLRARLGHHLRLVGARRSRARADRGTAGRSSPGGEDPRLPCAGRAPPAAAADRRTAPLGGHRHRRPLRPARPRPEHRRRLRRPARPGLRGVLRGRRLHDRRAHLAGIAGLQPGAPVLGCAAVRDPGSAASSAWPSAPRSCACGATTSPS